MNHEAEPNDAAESIIVECDLAEPPAKVWKALTEPELLAAWLMPNDIRPEIGARFAFQADAGGGAIECEVLEVEPTRLLSYSWRGSDANRDAFDRVLDSVVTFVLTETATGGTHLRLVHDGFPLGMLQPIARLADPEPKVSSLEAERARRQARELRALQRRLAPISSSMTQGSLRWAA